MDTQHFATAVEAAVRAASQPAMPPVRQDGPGGRFYLLDSGDGEPIRLPSVTHILSCLSKPALVNWAANQERALVLDAAADLYLDLAQTPAMSRPAYLATLQGRVGKQKAHQKMLAKAAEIGTQVHSIIEWNLRRALGQKVGPEPRVVDDAQWAFMSYQEWAERVDLRPVFIEQVVFSRVHQYAGTMDLFASVSGSGLLASLEQRAPVAPSLAAILSATDRLDVLVDFKTGKAIYAEAYLQSAAYQVALEEMGHGHATVGLILRLPKVQTDPAFEVGLVPPVPQLFPAFLAVRKAFDWWHAADQVSKAAWYARKAQTV